MTRILRFGRAGVLPLLMIGLFVILLLLLIPLLALGLAGAAFTKLGFSWPEAVAVIVLMAVGYFIDIPVWAIRCPPVSDSFTGSTVFDAFTGEPVNTKLYSTRVFLNIGGAILPVTVSGYLFYESPPAIAVHLIISTGVCLTAVALVVALFTRVLPGQGISVPLVLPTLAAVACSVLANGATGLEASVTAFSGGTLGILLGAGLAALYRGKQNSIPQISIGGAGMFGSVFLCALIAALIA